MVKTMVSAELSTAMPIPGSSAARAAKAWCRTARSIRVAIFKQALPPAATVAVDYEPRIDEPFFPIRHALRQGNCHYATAGAADQQESYEFAPAADRNTRYWRNHR